MKIVRPILFIKVYANVVKTQYVIFVIDMENILIVMVFAVCGEKFIVFFQDGLRFIAPIGRENNFPKHYKNVLIFFLIPGINLLYFMGSLRDSLFYWLLMEDDINISGDLSNYGQHYENCYNTL